VPLTTLDPTPALVVMDLQKGIVSGTVAHVVPNAAALAKAFREHDLPVVLAGVSTSAGVESTARSGHDHGYHVVLATDAMADHDHGSHRHSLERVFPKLGETATSAEVIDFLDRALRSSDRAACLP
jgi:nicotinamidase-related amidase